MPSPLRTPRLTLLQLTAVSFGLVAVDCLEPTQVTLELTTDAVCADLDETHITVGQLGKLEGRPPTATTSACDPTGRIGSIVVVPNEADSFGVEVVVGVGQSTEACLANGYTGGCIVARRALAFVSHTPLELPIQLDVSCIDVPCGALQTCKKGSCVSAVVEDPQRCATPGGCEGVVGGSDSGGTAAFAGTSSDAGNGEGGDGSSGATALGGNGSGGATAGNGLGGNSSAGTTTGGGGSAGLAGTSSDGGNGAGGDGSGGVTGGGGRGGTTSAGTGGTSTGTVSHVIAVTTAQDVIDGDVSSIDALLTTAGADGEVSLREALIASNNSPNQGAPDIIEFAIPGAGPHVIVVKDLALPAVLDAVDLDGWTQPGYLGTPVIELDGSSATLLQGTENGLHLALGSDGSRVRGFAIHGFPQDGILLEESDDHVIQNNYVGLRADGATWSRDLGRHGISLQNSGRNLIGGLFEFTARERNVVGRATWQGIVVNGPDSTSNVVSGNIVGLNAAGTAKARNLRNGIHLSNGASNNTIGGANAGLRNVTSGNGSSGLRINDPTSQGNVVQNNFIGTDLTFSGLSTLGNGASGIFINQNAHDNLIGGPNGTEGNQIAFNQADGVTVTGNNATRNAILGNLVLAGSGNPIDLADDSITVNDALDADTGPNDLLNFPEPKACTYDVPTNTVTVQYALDAPAGNYRVEFYTALTTHASGQGNLSVLAAVHAITHPGGGSRAFETSFIMNQGDWLAATVTQDLGAGTFGSTSEISWAVHTTYP